MVAPVLINMLANLCWYHHYYIVLHPNTRHGNSCLHRLHASKAQHEPLVGVIVYWLHVDLCNERQDLLWVQARQRVGNSLCRWVSRSCGLLVREACLLSNIVVIHVGGGVQEAAARVGLGMVKVLDGAWILVQPAAVIDSKLIPHLLLRTCCCA